MRWRTLLFWAFRFSKRVEKYILGIHHQAGIEDKHRRIVYVCIVLFIKNQRVFHKNLTNSTMQFQRRGLPRNHHGWYNRKWHWRSNWKASDVDKTHNFWIKLLKTILNRWLLIQTYFNHLLQRKTYLFQRNRAFLAFPNIDQSLIFSPSTDPVLCEYLKTSSCS